MKPTNGPAESPNAAVSKAAVPHAAVPKVADWFQNGFHRFLRPYLGRHFHAIAVAQGSRPDETVLGEDSEGSVIVFGNHPSWWDPMTGHFLNQQLFAGRQFYAPIDAEALEKYRVLAKLGFYGVQLNHSSGAAAFLKSSNKILDHGQAALWITPEGRFADVRDHDSDLMPGLAHLCHRRNTGHAIAMAMEYVFWDERLPVCLVQFGTPIALDAHESWSKADWATELSNQLRENQNELASLAITRDSKHFENLLAGRTGAGGIYDGFRRAKAWMTGKTFESRHGKQFQ